MTLTVKSFPGTAFFDSLFEADNESLFLSENNIVKLKKAFQSIDWVYVCVNLIARECSSLIPQVYLESVDNGEKSYTLQENHPVQKMLEKPTLKDDSQHFYYSIFGDLCLTGNAFIYCDNQFLKMYYVPSDLVSIQENGFFVNGKKVELLHVRLPSLTLSAWGLSPFIAGIPALEFNQYSQNYLNDFYRKGSTPQMILETQVAGNLETLEYLKKTFRDNYEGQRNQRKTLVLPKDVKVVPSVEKMADDKLVALLEHNRERIISLLGVPKHALSLQQAGSLGSEEHKQALKYFWQSTIIPFCKKMATALTNSFQRELGHGYCIDYSFDDVPILKDDLLAKAQLATQMLTTRTLNEIRKEVWEAEPLPGGDSVPGLQQQAEPLPSLPAIEPQQALTVTEAPILKWEPEKHPQFAQSFAEHSDLIKSESKEQTFNDFILAFFEKQLAAVIRSLKKKQKDLPTGKELREILYGFEDEYSEEYNQHLIPNLSLGYRSQLKLIFNETDRTSVELLRARTAKNEVAMLHARGLQNFAQLTKTTSKSIMEIIATGKEQNLSVTDIANTIIDEMGTAFSKRASTIARTETLTAVSIGQAGAMENAKEVIPDLVKVWITADDERVRGRPGGLYDDAEFDHWELHGDIVTPDKRFKNGLLYPREPGGEAGNVINCRCSFSLLSRKDVDSFM